MGHSENSVSKKIDNVKCLYYKKKNCLKTMPMALLYIFRKRAKQTESM